MPEQLRERCAILEENYRIITERMAEAALKSGRAPESVTLLGATKTVPVDVVNYAIRCGLQHIGENRVQELMEKYDALLPCDRQFIGVLQKNKVKQLIGKVSLIQSVSSVALAETIARYSVKSGLVTPVLLEVNIGAEESKSGFLPDELTERAEEISALPGVSVQGLMTIPPICENSAQTERYFSSMYKYFIDIGRKKSDNMSMNILSMGMSADYELAIRCGANMVRIGSLLFGKRIYN